MLLLRGLPIDDDLQVEFCRRLGEVVQFPKYENPNVMEISFDPSNPNVNYFPSNDHWHFDGSMDDTPAKAVTLSARVLASDGGETEFASTYAAYDALSHDEKESLAELRVLHTFEAIQRRSYPDPTPEQLEDWATWPQREHPLVWEHRSGRRSLVLGHSASHVVGMDFDEGRALLDDLMSRATSLTACCGTTGRWATSSSGTTSDCCTAPARSTAPKHAVCIAPPWPATSPSRVCARRR